MKKWLIVLAAALWTGVALTSCGPSEPTPSEETNTQHIYQPIVMPEE